MKHIPWILVAFLISEYWTLNAAKAVDLGTHGHTFEIQEPDLLKEMESKLHYLEESGELEKHKEILLKKAEKAIRTPFPVEEITKTTQERIWYYDPSISVPYDLKDHHGRVFHKKGTRINPLQYRSLSSALIFIDGRDEEQVSWARVPWVEKTYLNPNQKAKIILIAGSPFDLMETLKEPVYFDQGGTLTKKLGIKHVPAVVIQEGLKLRVTKVALEEKSK